MALGLHRCKSKTDNSPASPRDLVELELGKRVFWCAYVLDKYLSAIFGRPCALNDDDTDQDLPGVVEDKDLTSDSMTVASRDNMSIMLGPISHHKLSRILSSALKRLYGVTPLDRPTQHNVIADLGSQISRWRCDLPAFLNPQKVDARLLRPLFQRQSNLLALASGHLEILIYRPCLLSDHSASSSADAEELASNVQRCIDAAMEIVATIDVMAEAHQLYPVSWFSHYQAFSAVVVLYTYTIKSRRKDPATWMRYFHAAERCQGVISRVPGAESLAQRLLLIMEEYRAEVVAQVQLDSPNAIMAIEPPPMPPNVESSWLPSTSQDDLDFIEFPNWEQLNSLVSRRLLFNGANPSSSTSRLWIQGLSILT